MYVDMIIKGKQVRALVDTRATHNFILKEKGLKMERDTNRIKAFHSVVKPIRHIANCVDPQIGG